MILIVDNFLTIKECKEVIKIYHRDKHLAERSNRASILPGSRIKKILLRTQGIAKKYFNPKILIDWAELKKHEKDSFHSFHFDRGEDRTVLSSVIYLNTLSSGFTIFKDGTKVSPIAGRLLLFDGQKYLHGVSRSQKKRYTIPIWYKLSS